MFFAFSILNLTSLKSPLQVEKKLLQIFLAQTSDEISPPLNKNPGCFPESPLEQLGYHLNDMIVISIFGN